MKSKIGIIIIFLFCGLMASAQNIQSHTKKVKDGYNFWLSTPKSKTDSTYKKPLIIFLHGASLRGNDLNKVLRYGTISAIKKGLDIDAYVMAPQTPGGWEPTKVMKTADWVIKNNKDIDTTRIYVIGMSLGGYGTIDVAASYPDRIAAAMALCGGGSVRTLQNLTEVPLWIVHGTADRAVSINESDRVVAQMKKKDPKTERLIYDRVQGMNHSRPARLFYMPSTYQWLFKHSLSDENRPVAKGFPISNSSLNNAYSQIKSSKVKVEDPEPMEDLIEEFIEEFTLINGPVKSIDVPRPKPKKDIQKQEVPKPKVRMPSQRNHGAK